MPCTVPVINTYIVFTEIIKNDFGNEGSEKNGRHRQKLLLPVDTAGRSWHIMYLQSVPSIPKRNTYYSRQVEDFT
ncbi:MAG: hypothetical protein NVS1B13_08400 [Flavisolibacter sp.]